ncbi:MAG: N-acetyltransferase [Synergistaceae bacterium]|nr:N-acetyltransferase [Synergistaceae bacterium]
MITITDATPSNALEILEIYAPYVRDTAISFEYDVPTLEEFRQRITDTLEKFPYLKAMNDDDEIVGYAYAGVFKSRKAYEISCETSIYVRENFHGHGVGRLLYSELETRLRAQGVLNLYACVAYPEIEDEYLTCNSVNFHEHLGFKTVGHFTNCARKFGRFYSMVWLEKNIS